MVLVGHGSNDNRITVWEKYTGWFAIPIANTFFRDYYLQYTNCLSLSDKESVIMNPVFSVHISRMKAVIKTESVL